jgi:hypothetical protein
LTLALAGLCLAAGSTLAQPGGAERKARDIVLDALTPAAGAFTPVAGSATPPEAMLVSVLVESPDGTLTPRSTEQRFQTGERFRVRVLAARPGRVTLYNTNPLGQFNPTPVWSGSVSPGLEMLSDRLALTGNSGVDQLHVVQEPDSPAQGVIAWIQNWLRDSRIVGAARTQPRDIVLDVDNTPQATYLVNPTGQGLATTIYVVHSR